jgi:hypothetical protein
MRGFLENLDYFCLARNLQNKIDAVAEQLSSGLNGKLERGGFWKGMPKIYISKKEIPAQVTFYNGGAKVPLFFTRFIFHGVTLGNYQMRIYDGGALSRFVKKLGMRDIEIGDSEFDKLFVIKSNDVALTKRLLNAKTRHSIKMLYEKQKAIVIDERAAIPDSAKRYADDKSMGSALKIVGLLFTPSCPTFEMRLDKRGLCLEVFGLINQAEKAQMLLDELMAIYSDWHLFRL